MNPTLSVVTELVNRGVRVTYFTVESFRHIIEPTGAKFVPVNSWMAENDKHNEKKEENKKDDGGSAAGAPFVFMMEAGANIDGTLEVLRDDPADAIMHDFAGIAGTMAADILHIPNIMIYTSYPSNETYSVAEAFENIPKEHTLRMAAEGMAKEYAAKYGCREMTFKEIFDGQGDLNLVMVQCGCAVQNWLTS